MIRMLPYLILVFSCTTLLAQQSHTRIVGNKSYELSNHLGNVLEVITDRKVDKNTEAEIVAFNDYYPYGMLMEGRHGQEKSSNYRYAFQGQEKDNEVKGKGNCYDFGARVYNGRIGRFSSIDPLTTKYPNYSPYIISGNMLTNTIDAGGLEPIVRNGKVIGYRVEAGQGPSQIAADLNNPETQEEHGYTLQKKVNYKDIVLLNYETFTKNGNYEGKDWVDNPNDGGYSKLNINEGDVLTFSIKTKGVKVRFGAGKAASSAVSSGSSEAIINEINGLLEPNFESGNWEEDVREARRLILRNGESFDDETKRQLIDKYNQEVGYIEDWNNLTIIITPSNTIKSRKHEPVILKRKIDTRKNQSDAQKNLKRGNFKKNSDGNYEKKLQLKKMNKLLKNQPINHGSKELKKGNKKVEKIKR